jgi:hypothetical protein
MIRRDFLRTTLASAALLTGTGQAQNALPPVRAITRGPKFHWFGYYDKLQFDPSSRYVLGMETAFENRSPAPEDSIDVGMIDLKADDKWTRLSSTKAWCWQQGCMLQWLPGSKTDVIYNDREGDRFVSRILNVRTGKSRTLPGPIYSVSPDAKWAIYPDFRRLHDLRPGYGYAGIPDPNRDVDAPENAGIWRMNLESGKTELLVPIRQALDVKGGNHDWANSKHWFNHLLYSPSGKRFIFLHRWKGPKTGNTFATRMITADADGRNLYAADPNGKTSHFIWRDDEHILAWAWHPSHGDKFYLFRDRTDQVEVVGKDVMVVNGHCTYLPQANGKPGADWILNDTYPDKDRLQHPYLYQVKTGRRFPLGHFASPPEYTGEWRVDNHPRFSPDGKLVTIDSPHGGNGRQIYLIEIASVTRA